MKAALLNRPSAFISSRDVGYRFGHRAWLCRYVRRCAEGLAAHTWQILMVGQFPCHRLLCYQVASDPAQASTTRSWLAIRCGPGCDVPGLVVSRVTVSFETIYVL